MDLRRKKNMAKDVSLSDMPVFKKIVLGKNDDKGTIKENNKNETSEISKQEYSKNEYYEMLDKMNDTNDDIRDNIAESEKQFAVQAEKLGGRKTEIELGKDEHINVIAETENLEQQINISNNSSTEESETIIKISDSEVEIVDGEEEETKFPADSEPRYKSGYAANQLGISDQLLRNYCEDFSELVEIERAPSGHRQFSDENIEQLRKIINYMKKNRYTPAQTVKAIKAEMLIQEDPVAAHELMTAKLSDLADIIIEKMEAKNSLLLDDKLREGNTALSEKIEEIQKRQELIHEGYQKIIEVKNTQIDELLRQNAKNKEAMEKLIKERDENLIASMREIMKENENHEKKKSWFPWSK